MGGGRADLTMDRRDSAPAMPKGFVTSLAADWATTGTRRTPWADTVIYETHVKGISMRLGRCARP